MEQLNGMVVFVKVVQEGSFSAAARALDMPKSTVSRQISRLEDHLGVRLLNRTTRSLHLTDLGTAYFERAERIVTDIEEAEEAVTQMQAVPRGPLRVTAPLTFGTLFLGDLVADFLVRYSDVRLDLVLTDRKADIIDEGFDLAVRAGTLQDSSLIARKLGAAPRVVCASPDYLARRGRPTRPEDLRDHDCLRYGYEATGSSWKLSEGVVVQVNGPLVANNGELLRKAAVRGLGVCLLPRFMVGPDLVYGRLIPLLEDFTDRSGGVYALYPHNRHLSAKVRAFVDFAVEWLGPVPPWELCEKATHLRRGQAP
ncbi:MAG: LysR family transcriptional regulator [Alphaproteobacteria bacterium]|nr:LysR family transcriptional regulator [Alphaproteobacteria bacterium]